MEQLRAFIVSVDYTDLLRVTLPYNRHHFTDVVIVTSPQDKRNVIPVAKANDATTVVTPRFYDGGADFNKWAALEYALDLMRGVVGDLGWVCLMDADILWPRVAPLSPRVGELWTPLRHMAPWPRTNACGYAGPFPPETEWSRYPIHRNVAEWAGYSQIFHASDPHLPAPPWHETDWKHAGGADSLFQRLWPTHAKRRPAWNCLHLGDAGQNWYGRATPLADGSRPAGAAERLGKVARIWAGRRELRASGANEAAQFRPEKLG